MARDGGSLWLPAAEYRRDSSATIEKRNAKTLELEMQFEVADHIGCIAAGPDFLVGGNWDSRNCLMSGTSRGSCCGRSQTRRRTGIRNIKFVDGKLVGGGLLPGRVGAIDWLEWPSLKLLRRVEAGKTSRDVPYTNEGMAILAAERLLLLPEDGPSRLFEFALRGRA